MEILGLLSQHEGQHKCNLKQINEFFKELTKSKSNSFSIENFSDFVTAFKCCSSIGTCSILAQFAVNSYILYDDVTEITRDREYYKQIINYMIKNTGPIYKDITELHTFISHNNSYFYAYHDLSNVEIFKLIAELQINLCPDLLYNGLVKSVASEVVASDVVVASEVVASDVVASASEVVASASEVVASASEVVASEVVASEVVASASEVVASEVVASASEVVASASEVVASEVVALEVVSERKPIRRIKVGFISDTIVALHSVTKDRLGIIKHLYTDPEFDVKIMTRIMETDIFFNNFVFNDIDTSDLLVKMDSDSLIENRQQIADQHFDIIVYPEIGMCPKNRWIAFSRLAPIQINTWGHSDTSGLPNIDYFVSSKHFNSPDDQCHYSEKLIRFNSLGTYYHDICQVLKQQPDFANHDSTEFREKIIEKTGIKNPNIYGCLQSFFKTHPSFIKMLNDILTMDPNGVIVILASKDGDLDNERYIKYMNAGIANNDRLHFVYRSPFTQHALDIKNCDLILDYFPFGGFNSTIESFSLGKICITRPGQRISGKFTQGLYEKMGITEFTCKTDEEYVQKAVEYGTNCEKRKEYENCIAENLHKIFEESESVDEWKELLKNLHNGNKLNY
jgi:predicted O-linked N-acetylglucosamine transferase (SPINDLY family)